MDKRSSAPYDSLPFHQPSPPPPPLLPLPTHLILPYMPLHRRLHLFQTLSSISTHTRRGKPFLSLHRFIQRQQVLALYRAILRTTTTLPKTSPSRAEIREYARAEFERNRFVNEDKIKYLLAMGREDLERLRGGLSG